MELLLDELMICVPNAMAISSRANITQQLARGQRMIYW